MLKTKEASEEHSLGEEMVSHATLVFCDTVPGSYMGITTDLYIALKAALAASGRELEYHMVSIDGRPVTTIGGLEVSMSEAVTEIERTDLVMIPAVLVQVGSDEILLSDSIRLAENAKAHGVQCHLQIWPHMWHDFQSFAPLLPTANDAIKCIGQFIEALWMETSNEREQPTVRKEAMSYA